jgi:hypothetical protein
LQPDDAPVPAFIGIGYCDDHACSLPVRGAPDNLQKMGRLGMTNGETLSFLGGLLVASTVFLAFDYGAGRLKQWTASRLAETQAAVAAHDEMLRQLTLVWPTLAAQVDAAKAGKNAPEPIVLELTETEAPESQAEAYCEAMIAGFLATARECAKLAPPYPEVPGKSFVVMPAAAIEATLAVLAMFMAHSGARPRQAGKGKFVDHVARDLERRVEQYHALNGTHGQAVH